MGAPRKNDIPGKHMIRVSDEFWNKVLKFKIDNPKLKNLNDTVLELIGRGLEK